MTGAEVEKAIVALACWQIGHQDGYQAMKAAASMFQNQVAADKFETLYQAAVYELTHDALERFPDTRDPEFANLLLVVDAVFDNRLIDKTNGALWYLNTRYETPSSAFSAALQIGQLVFYK